MQTIEKNGTELYKSLFYTMPFCFNTYKTADNELLYVHTSELPQFLKKNSLPNKSF